MRKLYEFLIGKFLESCLWRFIGTKILGKLTFRLWGYPKFDSTNYFEIRRRVYEDPEAVYVFVGADTCSVTWWLSRLFVKNKWGHAGFIRRRDDGEVDVSHVSGKGFHRDCLLEYLKAVDHFALIKLPAKSPEARASIRDRREKLDYWSDKIKYAFSFRVQPELADLIDANTPPEEIVIYCSTYIYAIGAGLVDDSDFDLQWVSGRLSFTPDDVYKGGEVLFEA